MTGPVRVLAELAAANRWQGPLPDQAIERDVAGEVRILTLNQWDQHAYFAYTDQSGHFDWTIQGPVFDEAYAGEYRALRVLVANTRTFLSATAAADAYNGRTLPAGVVAVSLPFAVPYLTVCRPLRSLFGGHGWCSGDANFDKHYHVTGRGRAGDLADEMLPPLVPIIGSRTDWAFTFFGPYLICATQNVFGSAADARATLDLVTELVSAMRRPSSGSPGMTMPGAAGPPGHCTVDAEAIQRHMESMTPREQEEFIAAAVGGRIPGGMASEEISRAIAEAVRRHRGR